QNALRPEGKRQLYTGIPMKFWPREFIKIRFGRVKANPVCIYPQVRPVPHLLKSFLYFISLTVFFYSRMLKKLYHYTLFIRMDIVPIGPIVPVDFQKVTYHLNSFVAIILTYSISDNNI